MADWSQQAKKLALNKRLNKIPQRRQPSRKDAKLECLQYKDTAVKIPASSRQDGELYSKLLVKAELTLLSSSIDGFNDDPG